MPGSCIRRRISGLRSSFCRSKSGWLRRMAASSAAQRACRLCTAACVLRAKLDSGGSSGRCTGSSCRGFSGCSSTVFSAEACGTAGACFALSGFMVPEATACRVCASLRAGGAASPSAKSCSIKVPHGLRLPASTSCLERHSCSAGRCPSLGSLFPPQAAVASAANSCRSIMLSFPLRLTSAKRTFSG